MYTHTDIHNMTYLYIYIHIEIYETDVKIWDYSHSVMFFKMFKSEKLSLVGNIPRRWEQ